ncbi:FAD-binding oxidoreductase [Halocynthiibacter styelae]|uniref:FAD-binding oxidoreductase n=1 Tax=Halocynthiibacter styelae TaxID=2761955 RepID=A0A8J7LKX3_9RHOB|nr:FAD-binding oxidoreductase [Paenihalocynthiibacter styelae]MBI1493509.1 FAD-binding oxidoreductase [Paenihalocynthiibacter styelae]
MTDILTNLRNISGDTYVLSGNDDRKAFDTDVFGDKIGSSLAVVRPANTDEVAAILKLAHETGTPVVPQGGNTGLAGGATPTADTTQIVLSLARMNAIENINPETRTATVQAGVILQNLHDAVAKHDLIFPLIFGARGSCMIGGNISTNAGGSNVLRYGNTRALVLGLEVVLPDGRVMNLMNALYKNNTGYALKDLIIGAEGTLGIITRAVLQLHPAPVARATALLSVASLPAALTLLRKLQDASGGAVEAFEFMPENHMQGYQNLNPDRTLPLETPGAVNILTELGATSQLLARPGDDGRPLIENLLEDVLTDGFENGDILDAAIAQNDSQRDAFWHIRESAYEVATSDGPAIDFDVSVPLDQVETFLDQAAKRLASVVPGMRKTIVSHLGDGNIHYGVLPENNRNGIAPALKTKVMEVVEDLVTELNGSFSAEHGIGTSKRPSMARQKDPVALDAMRAVKAALDPQNIMNPGKVLP